MSAGISVGTIVRAIDVHSFGNMIFEPRGFDGTNARTVGPLVEIFKDAETFGALAIVASLPSDIKAPTDVPMIIVGGAIRTHALPYTERSFWEPINDRDL
jgi:hypothetical protein